MSWVIIASISYVFLTTSGGAINAIVEAITGQNIAFLQETGWFRTIIIGQVIWKETGWGTVIFLAALAGVSSEQYEAAIDRKSTRLNSSHVAISYAVFCLKKKKKLNT